MTETNVFELTQPGTFSDPLTEVLPKRYCQAYLIFPPAPATRPGSGHDCRIYNPPIYCNSLILRA